MVAVKRDRCIVYTDSFFQILIEDESLLMWGDKTYQRIAWAKTFQRIIETDSF